MQGRCCAAVRCYLCAATSSRCAAPVVLPLYLVLPGPCNAHPAEGPAVIHVCTCCAGVADGYYQYMLKPWDVAAGIIILEEAGGRVTTCDGLAYSVFDRSLLASNDALYEQMLQKLEPRTSWLIQQGIHLGTANVPPGYKVKAGAQLE